MPLLISLLFGIGLGWASGGKLSGLQQERLRFPAVLLVLFMAQGIARGRMLGFSGWGDAGITLWGLISVCISCLMLVESSPFLRLAGLGTLLNALVVLANGYMPVATAAETTAPYFYVFSNSVARFIIIGDVLPLPLFGSIYYLSVGDVLLIVGVAVFVLNSMCTNTQANSRVHS